MVRNIQAMEIQKGLNAVTSTDGAASDGVFKKVMVVHCRVAGSITVTYDDGTTEAVAMIAGEDRTLSGLDIDITSGTFDLNC